MLVSLLKFNGYVSIDFTANMTSTLLIWKILFHNNDSNIGEIILISNFKNKYSIDIQSNKRGRK